MKPLEQRAKNFRKFVVQMTVTETLAENDLRDFIDYWTEHNEPVRANTKMRFEMPKNQPFNIGRRWGTWKKNAKRFNPPKQANGFKVNPDNWYWKGFDGQRFQDFKRFMLTHDIPDQPRYEWNTQFSKFNPIRK